MKAIIKGLPDDLSPDQQQRYGKTFLVGMYVEGLPVDGVKVEFEEEEE